MFIFIIDLKDYEYKMINNESFYVKNKDTYPPFKNGLYLEEYFLDKYKRENPQTKRKYIPSLWTNFQIEPWFHKFKYRMQKSLDKWVRENPSNEGYFTVVQYDDACLLKLPENTIVYGACSGDKAIPLIYEDIEKKLESKEKYSFKQKIVFCPFVGTITSSNILPNVRREMINHLSHKEYYKFVLNNEWTPAVEKYKQDNFIDITLVSKFALAPRGYGRSSFRFFEILQLGTIPVYLWNDVDWLPFKDVVDYEKFSIVLNVKDIGKLDDILKNIDEEKYNRMLEEYNKIKKYFTLEGMYEKIISEN